MKKSRFSQMDDPVDIVHCIKDALTSDVNTVYECVMEIYTLCKKTVTDKDCKIRALFELKGEYEKKIKNMEYELHTSRARNKTPKNDLIFRKSIIEQNNLQKRLNESEQSNIKMEILHEKSKERIKALMEENLELKSKIEETNKNTTWMNVRMIKEKESEMKLIRYKMNDEVNALKKQLDVKENEKIALNETLQLKSKEMEVLNVNLKKIEKDYQNLNTTMNQLKHRISSEENIELKLKHMESEAKNLKITLDHVTQRFQEDRNALREIIKTRDQNNMDAKSEFKNLYDENQKLNHEIVEATDKLESEKHLSSKYYLQLQNKETELTKLQDNIKCLIEGNALLNNKLIRSEELLVVEKQSSSDNYMKLMDNDLTISKLSQDISNSRVEIMTITEKFTRNISIKEESMNNLQKEVENLRKELDTSLKKLQKKKDQLKDVEKKSSERRIRVKKLEKELSRQRVEFRDVFERKRQKQYNKLTVKSLKVLMDGYNGLSEKLSNKPILIEGLEKTSVTDNREDSAIVRGKQIEEVCLDDDEANILNKGEITTLDEEDKNSSKNEKHYSDSVEQTINAGIAEHVYSQILDEVLLGVSTDIIANDKQTSNIVTEVLCDILDQVIDVSTTNKIFNQGVVKIVKESLLKFYDEDNISNPNIKINSRVQFIGLCKHFSRKFQTELRATYIAFNGSDHGIVLTKDNEMNIKDQINCTFE